jgi:hypothetical protein
MSIRCREPPGDHQEVFHGLGHGERDGLQASLPRLHLREVEDVAQKLEEVLAAVVDVREVARLFGCEDVIRLLLEELREAQDGVQGGPELVRHVREKGGLVKGGRLRRAPRRVELGRALPHPDLQHDGLALAGIVKAGILDGNGGVIHKQGEDGHVFGAETPLPSRAVHDDHPDDLVANQERLGEDGADVRLRHDAGEGVRRGRVILQNEPFSPLGDVSCDPFTETQSHFPAPFAIPMPGPRDKALPLFIPEEHRS